MRTEEQVIVRTHHEASATLPNGDVVTVEWESIWSRVESRDESTALLAVGEVSAKGTAAVIRVGENYQ